MRHRMSSQGKREATQKGRGGVNCPPSRHLAPFQEAQILEENRQIEEPMPILGRSPVPSLLLRYLLILNYA